MPPPLVSLRRRLLAFGARNRMPASEGNAVRFLDSGCAILGAIRELIRNARHTLHFETYIWSDDATGQELLGLLQEAQTRGVQVRGVVDQFGSWSAEPLMKRVWQAGLDVRWFNPIGLAWPTRAWGRRNHRKLVIADGCRAVVGSANWADEYNCALDPDCYIDLGVEVTGPVLAGLNQDFAASWTRAKGGPLPALPPESPDPGEPGAWVEGVSIQLVSGVNPRRQAIRRHLLLALRQVRQTALVASAYFVPDPKLLRALARAARRGVSTDLLLPGASDHPAVQAASRATFQRLLQAGVRIWERQERMLHAKAAVLDREVVILGSANLDALSFRRNLELNLVLVSPGLAATVARTLERNLTQSRAWDLSQWEALPAWRKLLQRMLYTLWPWL